MRFESYNAHYYQMKLSHQSALKSDATVRTTARTPKVGSKGTTTSLHQLAKVANKIRFNCMYGHLQLPICLPFGYGEEQKLLKSSEGHFLRIVS